ncbi:MAG TPA: D-glycero-beta-D-manno-heptose-7-phosphate kinase [Vicinamibacterales bacterium]|nr:D-glycero-beta-D-manno-heptose-7-phosphate kinase [Vicinamibacterales bacterium]
MIPELLTRFQRRSILVIGDVMLDHFVIGRVDRISPEAPVPVVAFDHEEYRLGGAANVAHNIVALGGTAQVVGVVGADADAARLASDFDALGIGVKGLVTDPDRCTTRKLRVVTTRNQQVARIDYERDGEVSGPVEQAIIAKVQELSATADAILISDYLKGAISAAVAQAAAAAARARGIPLLVDPKVPHVEYYSGATLITPNHHEAEAITHMRIRTAEDASAAAKRIRKRVACECVLITRGEHGMWLLDRDVEAELPAEAREVADVTGAGDTVISALALGLASGATLTDAARVANRAAGIVVGKFGPATVSLHELRQT